jgi:hypothetical protein
MIQFYSIEDCLGVPQKEVQKMFAKEVWAAPNMIKGAKESLEWFIIHDYDVYIYSHRLKYMTLTELQNWLDKYNIPFTAVVPCSGLPSHALAVIDDSPSKLLEIEEKVFTKKLLLYFNPWNELCIDILHKFKRVRSWKDVMKEIKNG